MGTDAREGAAHAWQNDPSERDQWCTRCGRWRTDELGEAKECRGKWRAGNALTRALEEVIAEMRTDAERLEAERDALRARVAELEGALFRIAEHKHEECDADTVNAIYPGQCLAWAEIQAIQALGPALDAALKEKP